MSQQPELWVDKGCRSERSAHLDVDPLPGRAGDLLLRRVHDAEVEGEGVDGHAAPARGGLQHRRQEGGGVGEAGQPVQAGVGVLRPLGQLLDAGQQVTGPGAERLQGGVGLQPGGGDL